MAKKQVSGRFGESVLTVRRMIQGVVDMDRASVINEYRARLAA